MTKPKIALLIFPWQWKKHRVKSKSSFDWNLNIGACIIKQILEEETEDYKINFTTAENAHKHEIILISLTSTIDNLNLLHTVKQLKTWQKENRKFKTIVGGFGLQNIYPIRDYIDYAIFGRAEEIISDTIKHATDNTPHEHPSIMNLPQITNVKIAQTTKPYPHTLNTKPTPFTETMLGCHNRCRFCHYTYSRKQPKTQHYDRTLRKSSKEYHIKDIPTYWDKRSRLTTSIDGFSQRLRKAFHKNITDTDIQDTLEYISKHGEKKKAWIQLYNIVNYPTETQKDIEDFHTTLKQIKTSNTELIINIQPTPFRPSIITPSQWMPVNIEMDWSNKARANIIHEEKLWTFNSRYIESPFTHLSDMVMIRSDGSPEDNDLINTLLFNTKLKRLTNPMKLKALEKKFDLNKYTKEYEIKADSLPTNYLESYTPNTTIMKLAKKLKNNLEESI